MTKRGKRVIQIRDHLLGEVLEVKSRGYSSVEILSALAGLLAYLADGLLSQETVIMGIKKAWPKRGIK